MKCISITDLELVDRESGKGWEFMVRDLSQKSREIYYAPFSGGLWQLKESEHYSPPGVIAFEWQQIEEPRQFKVAKNAIRHFQIFVNIFLKSLDR